MDARYIRSAKCEVVGYQIPAKKFTFDNNVFFEFHPTYFLVKD